MSNFIEFIEGKEGVNIGDERVIDYEEAVDWGLEPESYKRNIPVGFHTVKLIFKTWGARDNLIDFSESGNLENIYQIEVKHSPKGYPIILSASLLKAKPCITYPRKTFQ